MHTLHITPAANQSVSNPALERRAQRQPGRIRHGQAKEHVSKKGNRPDQGRKCVRIITRVVSSGD